MFACRTKSERAEQFSKRMHKDGTLTKAEKDAIKAKNMISRDRWEENNLGNFRRVFPHESYVSQNSFNKHTPARIYKRNMKCFSSSRFSLGTSRMGQSSQVLVWRHLVESQTCLSSSTDRQTPRVAAWHGQTRGTTIRQRPAIW